MSYVASSKRSVSLGAAQKTAREKVFFSRAVFCSTSRLTGRLEEASHIRLCTKRCHRNLSLIFCFEFSKIKSLKFIFELILWLNYSLEGTSRKSVFISFSSNHGRSYFLLEKAPFQMKTVYRSPSPFPSKRFYLDSFFFILKEVFVMYIAS